MGYNRDARQHPETISLRPTLRPSEIDYKTPRGEFRQCALRLTLTNVTRANNRGVADLTLVRLPAPTLPVHLQQNRLFVDIKLQVLNQSVSNIIINREVATSCIY